jgi:hypothetical protein
MSVFKEILNSVAMKWVRPASVIASNRKDAEAAITTIRAGEPLDGGERLTVIRILEQTLDGYDPRKGLGIAPKAGRPQIMAGHHAFLAAHYWSLRELDPLEKNAASTVAEIWGISLGRVRKIASENREKADVLRAKMSADEIAVSSRACAEYP